MILSVTATSVAFSQLHRHRFLIWGLIMGLPTKYRAVSLQMDCWVPAESPEDEPGAFEEIMLRSVLAGGCWSWGSLHDSEISSVLRVIPENAELLWICWISVTTGGSRVAFLPLLPRFWPYSCLCFSAANSQGYCPSSRSGAGRKKPLNLIHKGLILPVASSAFLGLLSQMAWN